MAIREGAWDCPTCGQKGLPGSRKHCGGCGTVRGEEVQFYLPDGAREVTEQEELRRANAGPDWKCPYCGGDNPGFNSHCSGCGSSRDGTEKRATKITLNKALKPAKDDGPNWLPRLFTGCCLLILLFFVGCWLLNRTSVATMQIQSMSWQRSIDVEVLGLVTDEGWQDKGEVPSNARVLSRSRQVREHKKIQTGSLTKTRTVTERVQTGSKKVKVGTKDLGNGYFEDIYEDQPVYESKQVEERYDEPVYRDEPVYDTRVRYEVERWHKQTSVTQNGDDNAPRWPILETGPKRRAGARQETYKIVLTRDGKTYTYQPAADTDFTQFSPGQQVTALVTMSGVVKEIRAK